MDAEDAEVDEAQGLVDDLLKVAVKSFTVKTVDKLIEKHVANHHQVSAEGHTLLHEAAQHQSPQQAFEICKLLVKKHNLKATAMDNRKQTAVFFAAKCGNVQLCEYLLQEGCEVDHVDIAQQTPLFYAARGEGGDDAAGWQLELKRCAAVDYAVDELGADPRRSLIKKQNNLFLAAKHGNLEKLQAPAPGLTTGFLCSQVSEAEKKQQKALEAAEKKRRAAALREQKKRENEEKKRRQRQQQLEQQEKRRRQAEDGAFLILSPLT
eukprot:Skav209507  [mRNA]  locus=scaffold2767:150278:154583:+ [translate_table: standard]